MTPYGDEKIAGRTTDSLAPLRRKKKNKIEFVNLTLTYQCQLKCSMCGQVAAPEDAPNSQTNWTQLPLEIVKQRLEELSEDLVSVYLFGGEPLIYPHIFELSDYLTEKGISFSYSTNGLLLKKHSKRIVGTPPELISISMDGCSPDIHDEIRGVKGSWNKAILGIEALLVEREAAQSLFPKLKIHFTITPQNYKTVKEFYNFYMERFPGIDFIKFHVPRFATTKMGVEYFELMQDEFNTNCLSYLGNFSEDKFVRECIEDIDAEALYEDIKWALTKEKSAFLGPTDRNEFIRYFKDPAFVPSERNCFCSRSISIQPNGDIANCGDYPDLSYGNIKNDKLEDAWNTEVAKKWRAHLKGKSNPGVLAKCSRLYKTTYGPINIDN